MNHEFHAHYPFALQDSVTQAFAMEWLGGKLNDLPPNWPELGDIQDPMQRIALLAQASATSYKEQARMGTRKDSGGFRYWVEHQSREFLQARLAQMGQLGLLPTLPDVSVLPAGAWGLQFTFTLRRPYLSRDDVNFYILDNPVKKERVFQVPMMAAASWKGVLRWTLMHTQLALKKDELDNEAFARERVAQTLLFGDEKGEEPGQNRDMARFLDDLKPEARAIYEQLLQASFRVEPDTPLPHHAGRLYFYPTYFDRLGLEVINPHSRESSAGEQPIYFESVPVGAQGVFTLLYVPFDLIGQSADAIRTQVAADAQRLAQGLQAMFCTYGFGAKTSSGYGLAEERTSGAWRFRSAAVPPPDAAQDAESAPPPNLPRYLAAPNRLQPEFLNPDGTFRERSAQELQGLKKAEQQLYIKAKSWWEREGQAAAAPESLPEVEVPPVSTWEFATFAELVNQAERVAEVLRAGGKR